MRVLLSLAATLLVSSVAVADTAGNDFGLRGQLILSADRLSPVFSYSRVKTDQGNGDSTTQSTTSMNVLWAGDIQDFYDIPRAGLDYVLAPNITLGGSVFFTIPMSSTRSTTQNNTTTDRDGTKTSALGLGARVGYVIPMGPKLSFWPRGGLSYSRVGQTNPAGGNGNTDSTTITQTALNLEGLFVFSLAPHFGIQLGPVIDLPLSGNTHDEVQLMNMTVSSDNSSSQFHFGITAGVLGYL